jgi:hypothetical protein
VIVDELLKGAGYETFIVLTYGADLGLFESFLLQQLRRRGVRQALVFADEARLSESIERDMGLLTSTGRRYVAEGLRAATAFHPKLYLLSGPEAALLFVGSGNLTGGGLERNLEIFERWEARKQDAAVPRAFEVARQYIQTILQRFRHAVPDYATRVLTEAFAVPVLTGKPLQDTDAELWGSPGPLLERLDPPNTPATALTMLAPYFDDEGEAAITLARRLRAKSFDVVTDVRVTNLSPAAAKAIRRAGGAVRTLVDTERHLHAKALHAHGRGWQLAISGSANLSNAAWRGSNAELVAVRRGEGAAAVRKLLDGLGSREFNAKDIARLRDVFEKRTQAAAERQPDFKWPVFAVSGARWKDNQVLVEVHGGSLEPTAVQLKQGNRLTGCGFVVSKSGPGGCTLALRPPSEVTSERPVAVRVNTISGEGSWSIVHSPLELEATGQARSNVEDRLRQFLSADPDDGLAAEGFFRFMADTLRERLAGERGDHDAAQPIRAEGESNPPRQELIHVTEADFAASAVARGEEEERSHLHHETLNPRRLLLRLLFGDLDDVQADANEGESDVITDEDGGDETEETRSSASHNIRPRRHLLAIVTDACAGYVSDLKRAAGERSAARLLEDVLVLMAALQRTLRMRQLSTNEYLDYFVPVVREMLGGPFSPLPHALRRIPSEFRREAWLTNQILPGTALVLYNLTLAERASQSDLSRELVAAGAALWFRHVWRNAPNDGGDDVLQALDRQTFRLRKYGDLWFGDLWPAVEADMPFTEFVKGLIVDADALEALDAVLRESSAKAGDLPSLDNNDVILTLVEGHAAAGFIEPVGDGPRMVAQITSAPFQRPDGVGRYVRTHVLRVPKPGMLPLREGSTSLPAQDPKITRAVELLRRVGG